MAGIVFFNTQMMDELRDFYLNQLGMSLWVDQGGCIILEQGNMLLGFCQRDQADLSGTITFFYPDTKQVDEMYRKLADRAEHAPRENTQYRIYNFFARDPEGRSIEFQTFLHELRPLKWTPTPLI